MLLLLSRLLLSRLLLVLSRLLLLLSSLRLLLLLLLSRLLLRWRCARWRWRRLLRPRTWPAKGRGWSVLLLLLHLLCCGQSSRSPLLLLLGRPSRLSRLRPLSLQLHGRMLQCLRLACYHRPLCKRLGREAHPTLAVRGWCHG